jgi:hypothetical protein
MRLAGGFGLLVAALVLAGAAQAQSEERELPGLAPAPDDALTDALESGELTEAQYALERARSLFQLGRVRREFGDVERPGPRDATLILRDLAVRRQELSGSDRAVARGILARPDDGEMPEGIHGWTAPAVGQHFVCGVHVCIHWVSSTSDAPDLTDSLGTGFPDYVTLQVLTTWEIDVWTKEIDQLKYRAPLSDATSQNHGPDGKLDVYIEDLGADGLFGFCTTDDPNANVDVLAVSGYCVIDNDYAADQFGSEHTPEEFLQVTSAHEFHHASQFAYDWLEDFWLMEGTAVNMEEEVYPDISDNVNFLRLYSPLNRPGSPLDRGGFGDSEYGAWIFFRFLQEKIAGDDHAIVRKIWERAGRAPWTTWSSLHAVKTELADRGRAFPDVFAQFGRVNRLLAYDDEPQALALYPRVPLTWARTIGRQSPRARLHSWTINHLATRYFTFRPGKRTPADTRLRIRVELPRRGSSFMRASVIVVNADHSIATRLIRANTNRIARTTTRFGRRDVKRVDVVLSNGSTRTTCWQGVGPPYYSCLGDPMDNGRVFKLSAALR